MNYTFGSRIYLIFFIVCMHFSSDAQDGKSSHRIEKPSIEFTHQWSSKIDPRWIPGANIGNEDDGITTEFVEFSSDGKLLVTGNGQGEAFVLSASDGTIHDSYRYISSEDIKSRTEFDISGGRMKGLEVECGAFIPGTRLLILGGNLNGVKIFDMNSKRLVHHFPVEEEVDGLAVSSDGRFFAHAAPKGVQVLNLKGWAPLTHVQHGHKEGVVNSIDFSKDGSLMVSAGNYGHIVLTQTSNWQAVGEGAIKKPSSIKSVRFSPDGTMIAVGYSGGSLAVFNSDGLMLIIEIPLFYIEAVAWTRDGKYLMAGGRDNEGRLRIYDVGTWELVGDPEVQADHSNIEYIDVYKQNVVIAGEDGHVRVFKIK